MKEINKLVNLVIHGLKSHYDVIELSGDTSDPGKEQQLYNGVLEGSFTTDEDAATGMYNSDIYDQRFRMLKSRLRCKLYDLLYYIDFDFPVFTHTVKVDLECKEYIHKAHILFQLGEYAMSDKQLNKALTLAEENELTLSLIEGHELKRAILSHECKPTEFDITLSLLKDLRIKAQAERESEDLFLKVRMLMSKSVHSRNTCQPHVKEAIQITDEAWNTHKSINIYLHLYQLNIWSYLLNEDYLALSEYTKKAGEEINKMKADPNRFDWGHNSFISARALLAAEKYEEGYKEAKIGFKQLDKSTEAWFAHSETLFLLSVHNKDYSLARETLDSTLKNPNYNRASESTVSRWKVFRIYLNFAAASKDMLKRVRFTDVHQASEYYYIESKGYYISLPLLEFIHNINKNKLDAAESKLDEIENYFFKYLNEPGKNPREKQFYKMLKLLKSEQYNLDKIQSKAAKYFEKLSEKRTYPAFSDFEIIPYEHLWEMVLKTIGKVKTMAN